MQAALAELSAQWLASHASNPVPDGASAGASEETYSSALQSLAGERSWRMAQESQAEASASGSKVQTGASRIWDAARQAFVAAQPASPPATAPGSSLQLRRRGVSDDTRPTSERVLPSLLLQALAPLPRQQLLQASMAALYAQLPDVIAKAREGAAPLDWEDTARRTLAAAVVSGGRAWFASYPQFQAELASSAAAPPALTAGDAGSALALSDEAAEAALASVQPMLFAEALGNAAGEAAEVESLGGRLTLYGTLMQSLTQGELALSAAEWGTSGTLLGGVRTSALAPRCVLDTRPLAAAVLQDMAVRVSEAVASAYVFWARGESRADGPQAAPRTSRAPAPGLSGTLASRALLLPRLRATRALERFRNEVALSAWVHLQYTSVRDIYEDRQPLWGVAPGGSLLRRELPVSRRAELDSLVGWRRTVRCGAPRNRSSHLALRLTPTRPAACCSRRWTSSARCCSARAGVSGTRYPSSWFASSAARSASWRAACARACRPAPGKRRLRCNRTWPCLRSLTSFSSSTTVPASRRASRQRARRSGACGAAPWGARAARRAVTVRAASPPSAAAARTAWRGCLALAWRTT